MTFAKDIFNGKKHVVIFKIARFLKRNYNYFCAFLNKVQYNWLHIKHEIRHVIQGFKDFGTDVKWAAGTVKANRKDKYHLG